MYSLQPPTPTHGDVVSEFEYVLPRVVSGPGLRTSLGVGTTDQNLLIFTTVDLSLCDLKKSDRKTDFSDFSISVKERKHRLSVFPLPRPTFPLRRTVRTAFLFRTGAFVPQRLLTLRTSAEFYLQPEFESV